MFFDDEMLRHICDQTNLYSVQQSGSSVNVTVSEIEKYIGILITMGIFGLPQYRLYWSKGCRIQDIAESMSVNRFDKIKQFVHFNDTTKMPKKDD